MHAVWWGLVLSMLQLYARVAAIAHDLALMHVSCVGPMVLLLWLDG